MFLERDRLNRPEYTDGCIFAYFKYLNILRIRTENIGELYESGLEWLRYLIKEGFSKHDSLVVKLVKFREEICSPSLFNHLLVSS